MNQDNDFEARWATTEATFAAARAEALRRWRFRDALQAHLWLRLMRRADRLLEDGAR